MSAFLGPIHHWLYHKVLLQEELIDDIMGFAIDNNIDLNLSDKLEQQFGTPDKGPLEEIIDASNIHGWLQDRIAITEYRLSYAITTLLQEDPERLALLKNLFFTWGVNHSVSADSSLENAFKLLNDTLLDGMPCDWVNEVILESTDEIKWKRTLCVHHRYWDEVNGDVNHYYELREELIKGIFSNSTIKYQANPDSTFSLTRG